MAERSADRMRQADADLRHARNALADGDTHDEAGAAIGHAEAIIEYCRRQIG